MDGIIEIRVLYSAIANYSMVYNRVPLIKRIEVRNISSESLGNIKLNVSFKQNTEQSEQYESEWESSIGSIPAGQYVSFDRIPLKISRVMITDYFKSICKTKQIIDSPLFLVTTI